MSDNTPPAAPEPTPPASGYSAQQPAQAPYGAAPGTAAGTAAKAPVLSIISLVAGIVGFLGAWIVIIPFVGSILGLFIPAAAVVLGVLGKKKEPHASKGLWLTGIILGAVGIAIAIIALIGWIVLAAVGGATIPANPGFNY